MLDDLWLRFEQQLQLHAPSLLRALRPPATMAYLAACEAALGMRLPDDVRDAYLRHDGSDHAFEYSPDVTPLGLFGQYPWLPLARVLELYGEVGGFFDEDRPYFEPETEWAQAAVRHWDDIPPSWVPIAQKYAHVLLVDLAPGPAGRVGQIVGHNHGHADNGCWLQAYSLSSWVRALADGLEAGRVRPARVNEGFSHDWVNARTGHRFQTLEHSHAFGFD